MHIYFLLNDIIRTVIKCRNYDIWKWEIIESEMCNIDVLFYLFSNRVWKRCSTCKFIYNVNTFPFQRQGRMKEKKLTLSKYFYDLICKQTSCHIAYFMLILLITIPAHLCTSPQTWMIYKFASEKIFFSLRQISHVLINTNN